MEIFALWLGLYAAHDVADYWVQTPCQSADKGKPGWVGRLACFRHASTYTISQAVALALVSTVVPITWTAALIALAVSGGTHYIIDRRSPLRKAARWFGQGKVEFYDKGGAPALDQSAHKFMIFLAALLGCWLG